MLLQLQEPGYAAHLPDEIHLNHPDCDQCPVPLGQLELPLEHDYQAFKPGDGILLGGQRLGVTILPEGAGQVLSDMTSCWPCPIRHRSRTSGQSRLQALEHMLQAVLGEHHVKGGK